jgi:hypothetical protein
MATPGVGEKVEHLEGAEVGVEIVGEGGGVFGTDVPEPLAAAAEEVRAWFVQARGGAPFLSGKDGRLLVAWLESGIPVSSILIAIEQVAARRVARRARHPFHLDACEATLKKLRKGALPAAPALPVPEGSPVEGEEVLLATARQRLHSLTGDQEARLQQACQIVRELHAALWELHRPQHPALLEQASKDLEDLAPLLGESGLQRAAEERARDSLRRRYPEFSMTRICEELFHAVA